MAKLIPLAQLADEGFADSASAMFLSALDRGLPVGIDSGGRVGIREREADRLRQRKREAEAAEAAEAERQRIEAQDATVAELVRAAEQEETRARIRRIEERVGPYYALQAQMTALAPGYVSVEEQASFSSRVPTLDEVERFCVREYGLELDPV